MDVVDKLSVASEGGASSLDLGLVYTTCASRNEALKIAQALVQKKLVACAHVAATIESIYFWQNKVCQDHETPLLLKTKASLFDAVRSEIKRLHSYTCPCVLMWTVQKADSDYAAWLQSCVVDVE